jgi:ABC-2 type transport system permease protein
MGAIYGIGYRRYEGARLGRGYALRTLLVHSLRTAWGLGRPGRARVLPFTLLALVCFPAVIQMLVGAASQGEAKLFSYDNYFGVVQGLVALFCAAQAPELVSTDQQHRTLPLYFSRPLRRSDYGAARLGGMIGALLILILVPMALVLLGKLSIAADVPAALRAELPQLPAVLGTSITVAVLMGTISVALASLTPRRAIASASVLGLTLLTAALSQILGKAGPGALQRWSPLLSPDRAAAGVIGWIFQTRLPPNAPPQLAGHFFLAAVMAWTAAGAVILFTRCSRVDA